MAALPLMEGILREQPVSFVNCKAAVEWAMCSGGHSRCLEAVRVSMPSRLRETNDGLLGWRTDLFGTEKFWRGWFTNLSNDLLELKATKLLILAHTDRLDRTMTIGQMQGLFQLEVRFENCQNFSKNSDKFKKLANFNY